MGYLITRCPKCATAFRVTPTQLGAAKGSVRCGSCLNVFKALDHINKANTPHGRQKSKPIASKVSPSATPIAGSEKDNQETEKIKAKKQRLIKPSNKEENIELTIAKDSNKKKPKPTATVNLHREDGPEKRIAKRIGNSKQSRLDNKNHGKVAVSPDIKDRPKNGNIDKKIKYPPIQPPSCGKNNLLSTIQPAPVEILWKENKSTKKAWLLSSGIAFSVLLMVLQIAIFQFHILSKIEPYRNAYKVFCLMLGCNLPDLVDITKIRVSNLILRSHPTIEDVLIIDTILLNSAEFAQPYPDLLLEFNNINNTRIAFRQFHTGEYLGGELAGSTCMPSNQPIQLSIEIINPGPEAENYQMHVTQPKHYR